MNPNQTTQNLKRKFSLIAQKNSVPYTNEDGKFDQSWIDQFNNIDLTQNRAIISDADGKIVASEITSTELGYLSGVTSNIQDQIDILEGRGRFLSVWNSTTGLPTTSPGTLPYVYKTGDYYIVGTVGSTNYKPTGSSYIGIASTTIESRTVAVNDIYFYDGANWLLQINSQREVTFASITGQPTDNTNLANALNLKANLVSPAFTGTPTAPTPPIGTNTTQIATTAFVNTVAANILPNQSEQNGKFLTTNGSVVSWAVVNSLPSQTGQNGKFLTTNGTSASWSESTTWIYDAATKTLEVK